MRCTNCSKQGHGFRDCYYPVSSYGIIAFKKIDNQIKYLLVQRRHSIGYIDLVRGKYTPREDCLRTLVNEMTIEEKQDIINLDFDTIWNKLWVNKKSRVFINEYENAKKKFQKMDVKNMILESLKETKWNESEFSIPKGRKNTSEKILDCALREFTEETGINTENLKCIFPMPIEELFMGSNGVMYKHIYYIAEANTSDIPEIDNSNYLQVGEIKYINWFSYKEAMNVFRNYDKTKRAIIHKVNNIIINLKNISYKNNNE